MRARRSIRLLLPSAALALSMAATSPAGAEAPSSSTIRTSVASDGTQAEGGMSSRFSRPVISADGNVTAFDSLAENLVPNDTNRRADVFVHDSTTGLTERVSVSSSGRQTSADSTNPTIDGEGQVVAFDSTAKRLVRSDGNSVADVFVRNRTTGKTSLVSKALDGGSGNGPSFSASISADGRFVAFMSDASNLVTQETNGQRNVFVRDLQQKTTELVSVASDGGPANSSSASPSISADGSMVGFASFASNLVPNDTNGQFDVFVRDRAAGTTVRVSVATSGQEGDQGSYYPSMSGDGRFVAFASDAANLIDKDTNGVRDVFLHTIGSGRTKRVSVTAAGRQANGQSVGPGIRGGSAWGPAVNFDGSRVAFDSIATNLVAGDTDTCDPFYQETGRCPDVFVRDRKAGTTIRVSVSSDGSQENHASTDPSIDASGLHVVFFSAASNLVEGDTNTCVQFPSPGHCPDIFVHTI